jgi:hypothetical protein
MPTDITDYLSKQLEFYGEACLKEHEAVKRTLWQFEDNLAVGLGLYKAVHDRYWTWLDRVRRGKEPRDPNVEAAFKDRFEWWLRPCSPVMERLQQLESEYGEVAGADEFRRAYEEALQTLEFWTPQCGAEKERRVPAHTSQALTPEQMAECLDRVSKPTAESVRLKHRIDYSQSF